MTEAKNNIPVAALIRRVEALKLTPTQIIKRMSKTGEASGLAAIERHCRQAETPSEERIAAADYVRYVEAD